MINLGNNFYLVKDDQDFDLAYKEFLNDESKHKYRYPTRYPSLISFYTTDLIHIYYNCLHEDMLNVN